MMFVLLTLSVGVVRRSVEAHGEVELAEDLSLALPGDEVNLEDGGDEDPAHSDASKCWAWCHGSCNWDWGCRCECEENYHGACCTKMTTCGPDTEQCCPQENLEVKEATCRDLMKDLGKTIQVGGEELPASMQGIWWLTEQGPSSSIMSFARTNDGCGTANPEGVQVDDAGEIVGISESQPFKTRVQGDRVWAFSDQGKAWSLVKMVDLTYIWHIAGKTMTIIPHAVNWGLKIPKWLLQFDAHELDLSVTDEEDKGFVAADDAVTRARMDGGSKIWRRVSYYWFFGRKEAKSAQYDLTQIIDGKGNKLSPAFEDWVAFCESDEAGNNPGKYFYHEANAER